MYTHTHMYTYIYTYVCVCVCVCIYIICGRLLRMKGYTLEGRGRRRRLVRAAKRAAKARFLSDT